MWGETEKSNFFDSFMSSLFSLHGNNLINSEIQHEVENR